LRPGARVGADAIAVGGGPADLAAGPDGVWVAAHAGLHAEPTPRGRLVRIDPETLRPSLVLEDLGFDPSVAVGDGGVWTAPPLGRLDPASGRVVRPGGLGRVSVGAIAVAGGAVWVATTRWSEPRRGMLLRVDSAATRLSRGVRIGRSGSDLAVLADEIWVLDAPRKQLVRVDAASLEVRARFRVGRTPVALAAGAGALWTADLTVGYVARIDPASGRVVARIPVGHAPRDVAVDARGVWVAVTGAGLVVRIDPTTNRVVERLPVGGDPVALTADGRNVWVAMNSDGVVLRVPQR
jgi:DNA-binding beta-propeller fold protein YncE